MDPIDIVFRLVGLFYVLGGYFGLRAIAMDSFLDKAIAALTFEAEDRKERGRRRVIGASTIAIGAGGAALALLSFWALPLFLANVAAQGIWLAGARRFFIPPEDDDPASVRQLVRSSALYAAATVGVIWLWRDGRLGPWDDPVAIAGIVAVAAALAGWFAYQIAWKPASPPAFGGFGPEEEQETPPRRVVIDPAHGFWPLVDADTGERFNHLTWLDDELGWRVEHWDDLFQEAFDYDNGPPGPAFASPQAEAAYRAEAEAIAAALQAVYGEDGVSFGPGWTEGEDPAPA